MDIPRYSVMTITYQYKVEDNHLYLKCKGIFDQKALMGLFEEALQITGRHDRDIVLVDLRDIGGGPPTVLQRYELGVFIARRNHLGIHIVVVGEEPLIDPGRLAETVALNRGARGKGFTSLDEAVAWIEEQVADKH